MRFGGYSRLFLRKSRAGIPGTETGGIITGGPIGIPAETEAESLEDPIPADPAQKAAVLAEPKYPEDWQWRAYPQTGEMRPAYVRQTAGKEAADLYRSFFADIMLMLLSDNEQDNSVMSPVNIFMATAMLAQIPAGSLKHAGGQLPCRTSAAGGEALGPLLSG